MIIDCTIVTKVLRRLSSAKVNYLISDMIYDTSGAKQFRSQLTGWLCENPRKLVLANNSLPDYMRVDLDGLDLF